MHRLYSAEAEPFAKYLLNLSRKLKFHYGARNRFQEPGQELSSEATYAGVGRYDNPMPTRFLASISGT